MEKRNWLGFLVSVDAGTVILFVLFLLTSGLTTVSGLFGLLLLVGAICTYIYWERPLRDDDTWDEGME